MTPPGLAIRAAEIQDWSINSDVDELTRYAPQKSDAAQPHPPPCDGAGAGDDRVLRRFADCDGRRRVGGRHGGSIGHRGRLRRTRRQRDHQHRTHHDQRRRRDSTVDTITGKDQITLIPPSAYHEADANAIQAKVDLTTGYNNAAGQSRTADSGAELNGQTLVAGVYGTDSALGLTGSVTLDGAGKTDGVWVFQAGSTLITASSSTVVLTNGAQACNVYWQVGSSATLGTSTSFVGTILAQESITATTGATIQGRLLAQSGAVTLDTNTISRPSCDTGDTEAESSASSAASQYLSTSSAAASSSSEAAASSAAASISSASAAASSAAAAAAAAQAAAEAAAQAAQEAEAAAQAEAAAAAATAAEVAAEAAAAALAANEALAAAEAAAQAASSGYGQVSRVPVGSVDTGDGSLNRMSPAGRGATSTISHAGLR